VKRSVTNGFRKEHVLRPPFFGQGTTSFFFLMFICNSLLLLKSLPINIINCILYKSLHRSFFYSFIHNHLTLRKWCYTPLQHDFALDPMIPPFVFHFSNICPVTTRKPRSPLFWTRYYIIFFSYVYL
jgi:hypothetical protein